ncbi:MAG: Oligoendopeptidase, pepF/M3 family [candidate division WWE3 bacterium GW2011_GWC2_44_9]|uniref:Oligoendopeptidase, pepF/M3 family n=1 Tax=candidate division WWE3 bacterium GW2011_GWC2_44_9 TaxID=1619125 RepID=A0A0G1NHK9_UNCKA|nr:MAG: Oligoendopeptidase, pepF/M3 family [candidate division WWE3 bacterium GW2011_GWC2_44_9]
MQKTDITWDLTPLFASDDDPNVSKVVSEAQKVYSAFAAKWSTRTDYLQNPEALHTALIEFEQLARDWSGTGPVSYYFSLRYHQNTTDPKLKAELNKITELEVQLENSLEFFSNRLSKLDASTQKLMLESPLLKKYRHFLAKLFEIGKHTLSEPEEKLLNIYHKPVFSNWVHMVKEFISKEEKPVITEDGKTEKAPFPQLLGYLSSQNKPTRDSAARSINSTLRAYADVAEHELNSILQVKKETDILRNYPRPDSARHISDYIETSVVDALITAVTSRNSLAHRYYALKAKMLNVPRLKYHERNITLGGLDKNYTFDQTKALVSNVFYSLDHEFGETYNALFDKGAVDVYPRKGKSGGAFCASNRIIDSSYILVNFTNKITDATTLAHEMGHAINNAFTAKNQPPVYFGTSLAMAEVASTYFEDFTLLEIASSVDEAGKLSLLMARLNDDISTIFRQTACYRFETDLHTVFRERGYLSKKEIGELFRKHMRAYMGSAVEQGRGSENWWVYWSHIRSFFYVYSYTSGLLISKYFQKRTREDKSTVALVKKLLSAGVSVAPGELFKRLGIDISDTAFWQSGLNQVEATLEEAERLFDKKKVFRS